MSAPSSLLLFLRCSLLPPLILSLCCSFLLCQEANRARTLLAWTPVRAATPCPPALCHGAELLAPSRPSPVRRPIPAVPVCRPRPPQPYVVPKPSRLPSRAAAPWERELRTPSPQNHLLTIGPGAAMALPAKPGQFPHARDPLPT